MEQFCGVWCWLLLSYLVVCLEFQLVFSVGDYYERVNRLEIFIPNEQDTSNANQFSEQNSVVNSLFNFNQRVSNPAARSGSSFDADSFTNFTKSQIEDQSTNENITSDQGVSVPWKPNEISLPIIIPNNVSNFGTPINSNIQSAVAAVAIEARPEVRCLEVISECKENIYYVAFADGGPQLYRGDRLDTQGYYYWDAVGWYRIDANRPRAEYCTMSPQIAVYIDISGDRIQSPRSEVFWSRESGNDTGQWCVHPTKLFNYRYYWLPGTGNEDGLTGFFEDLDNGWSFETCDQAEGVLREFYEYPVTGVPSYHQLRILRC